jgi:hypothetical protein
MDMLLVVFLLQSLWLVLIPNVTSVKHESYAGEALAALERLLNFFESDANDLNLDGLYGLRLAQGQLNALQTIITNNEHKDLYDKNHLIRSLSMQIERIANQSLDEISRTASAYFERFRLITARAFTTDYDVRSVRSQLIEQGERSADFDEDDSDLCFSQVLGSDESLNSIQCQVSQSCWSMMTSTLTKDYRITHQLLWFLVAKNLGCFNHPSVSNIAHDNLRILEDRFCANIYEDAKSNYASNNNADLFLEQILLCSIIGYEDFLRLDWFRTILTWQDANYGCFTDGSDTVSFDSKMKRHLLIEKEMNNGCLSHKSGLAAGVLATYARAFLQ